MKCSEVEQQINSFIDDELETPLAGKVGFHLKQCRACSETFDNLRALRGILKRNITVADSSRLDANVMKAFALYSTNNQKKNWRNVIFGRFVISKPAAAFALLAFAVFTGFAFQLGKMSATDVRVEMPFMKMVNLAPEASEPNLPSEFGERFERTSVAPVIKFIKVPIFKEKIVTRIVYANKEPRNDTNFKSIKTSPANFALNSSINENRYATQVNLKEFQPVGEMKAKIIKKDENNEK